MPNVFWAAFGGGAAGGVVAVLAGIAVEWFRYRMTIPHLTVRVTSGYPMTPEIAPGTPDD